MIIHIRRFAVHDFYLYYLYYLLLLLFIFFFFNGVKTRENDNNRTKSKRDLGRRVWCVCKGLGTCGDRGGDDGDG